MTIRLGPQIVICLNIARLPQEHIVKSVIFDARSKLTSKVKLVLLWEGIVSVKLLALPLLLALVKFGIYIPPLVVFYAFLNKENAHIIEIFKLFALDIILIFDGKAM